MTCTASENPLNMATTKEIDHGSRVISMKRKAVKWVGVGNTAVSLRSTAGSKAYPILSNLEDLTRLIEETHKLRLPRVGLFCPEGGTSRLVKGFCGRILEPGVYHEWKSVLRRRDLATRVSVAASLFLFRKVVPSDEKPDVDSYIKKMSRPQLPPSRKFMEFVRRETCRMFPTGWDLKHWSRNLSGFTLPTTSCIGSGRASGGVRGAYLKSKFSVSVENCIENFDFNPLVETAVVWTGKWRLVSKAHPSRVFLRPLHKAIYDHLSEKEWLLRGEADPSRFADFFGREGEYFVSGDYESATDNVNINVSRVILETILSKSCHLPQSMHKPALHSLNSVFDTDEGPIRQERGQLMGNYLSFPLLCIINYLTFKFFVPREVPVKVNGDDIVFRSTPNEYLRWKSGVTVSGLTLCKGKTMVSSKVFSLNSTFFLSRRGRLPIAVPFFRSTCLFTMADGPSGIRGQLLNVAPGFKGEGLSRAQAFVIRKSGAVIGRMQGSIRRRLGVSVSNQALRMVGGPLAMDRERFYCSLPTEPEIPVLTSKFSTRMPEGFERVRVYDSRNDDPEFYRALVDLTWSEFTTRNEESEEDWWNRVRDGTFRYAPMISNSSHSKIVAAHLPFSKACSLLKLSGSRAVSYLRSRFIWPKRPEGKMVWRKKRVEDPPVGSWSGRSIFPCLDWKLQFMNTDWAAAVAHSGQESNRD